MKKTITLLLIIVSSFLAPRCASSADASIGEVAVSRTPALSITFSVKDAFTKDIDEAIKSGVPTTFTFIVKIDRVRSGWFNETVSETRFTHSVKYDALKEEYEIGIDEMGEKSIRTKDSNEMKALMSTVTSVGIAPKRPLEAGERYEFRIKAELHSIELPFLLDYVFFFREALELRDGMVHLQLHTLRLP